MPRGRQDHRRAAAAASDVEVTLLRAAQEALANVAKHASAARVGLTLSYMDDLVTLDVRDDGVGRRGSHDDGGFGLLGMRQRLAGPARHAGHRVRARRRHRDLRERAGATIRLVIADDHPVVRDGLSGIFSDPGFEVLGQAADGAQAVDLAARSIPTSC